MTQRIWSPAAGDDGRDKPWPRRLHPLHRHLLERIGHQRTATGSIRRSPICPVTGLDPDPRVREVAHRCTDPGGRPLTIRFGFADAAARSEYERDPDYYANVALDDLLALDEDSGGLPLSY